MLIIADLHIHSRFSRACSRDLTLENIARTCQIKGVNIVATGDFTHPEWFKEMKEKLVEKETGLYVLKSEIRNPKFETNSKLKVQNKCWIPAFAGMTKEEAEMTQETRFLCSTEISCIYAKGGKVRRLHIVVLAPSLEVVEKINVALGKIGNLNADGRPILGLDAKELARIVLELDPRCMIIPAHIWTPWFALFGSKSGFDSIEECFEYLSDKIYAIETGLSSDPSMNWRIKNLDNVSITSNSDAHSLPNIAREANVFEINHPEPTSEALSGHPLPSASSELALNKVKGQALEKEGSRGRHGHSISYDEICRIIKEKNPTEFLHTIEFYPEEGMYHYDGHRLCGVSFSPRESKKQHNICPVCKKPLTIGVLNRVEELAEPNRPDGYADLKRVPYKKFIELDKIIAEGLGVKARNAKQVQDEYQNLIDNFGSEFEILLNASYEDLTRATLPQIVERIKRMREGKIIIKPGFDGQYGEIKIFGDDERINYQKRLF